MQRPLEREGWGQLGNTTAFHEVAVADHGHGLGHPDDDGAIIVPPAETYWIEGRGFEPPIPPWFS